MSSQASDYISIMDDLILNRPKDAVRVSEDIFNELRDLYIFLRAKRSRYADLLNSIMVDGDSPRDARKALKWVLFSISKIKRSSSRKSKQALVFWSLVLEKFVKLLREFK
mgnify:CR=1 FL=1